MALSERSAQWQAELLLIHPERRDESVCEGEGASEGGREAVCVLQRGMLGGQGPYNGPIVHE